MDHINYKICFTPYQNCKQFIINEIKDTNTIKCSIYSLTDANITNQIKHKNYKIYAENARDINAKIVRSNYGIMHQKFCVLDQGVLTGSANFTNTSLDKMVNDVIYIDISRPFEKEFDYHEQNLFGYDKPKVKANYGELYIEMCPPCIETIIRELNSAKEVKCVLNQLTDPDVYNVLRKKSNTIIIEEDMITKYTKIQDLNIYITPQARIHAKMCILDNKEILTGSANYTENGLRRNDETIIIIKNKDVVQKYLSFFDHILRESVPCNSNCIKSFVR